MGTVFHVQRFSLHDGPGIRTTVFLAGCTLRCRWCHNPEGLDSRIRLQFDAGRCITCGACQQVCPHGVHELMQPRRFQPENCVLCGKCIDACPAGALQYNAKCFTPQELAALIVRDLPFYKTEGGVTFSGGEPLMQADFLVETARLCREQGVLSVTVDTAGNVPWGAFEKVLAVTDHFLFDIKAASEEAHIRGTGASNRLILENLRRLDKTGKHIYIRIPVIPGFNDDPEEMAAIGDILAPLRHAREVRLLPYHTFGREKYGTLGLPEPACYPVPSEEEIRELEKIIELRRMKHGY